MNWDQKASKAALPALLKESQQAHTAGKTPNVADAVAGPFTAAARWQRDQLRTDEAVERVALVMADATGEPRVGRFERTMAQAAIHALLGEEPRP